jgi:hypothetical protein
MKCSTLFISSLAVAAIFIGGVARWGSAHAADAPASAQDAVPPAPPYIPFTMGEADYNQIMSYLNGQPAGIANPLIGFLAQREQAAQTAKK